ncbi:phosphopantetheine binding protein [Streptomyces puniciscabiei]|uniref:Phosphopantetheine binding protein n=1 Tax=Streptomyces puniciscabiei TaxID=164348 RepID=A0A542SXC2_9ACTN|nr:phosphopantetheine-binding protein [Streptomyces puniciscabiei]TQK79260.1 phosphopantetheine binding protein [Streptomyces puniciscabiei]
MSYQEKDFSAIVQDAVADALGIDIEEVVPEATLLGDLDAESIDLLDVLFRIERASDVKIKVADIAELLQGGIPDEEFADEDDIINEVGLAQLKKSLPQIDVQELAGKLTADEVLTLFTVQNLTDLVAERASLAAAAA